MTVVPEYTHWPNSFFRFLVILTLPLAMAQARNWGVREYLYWP